MLTLRELDGDRWQVGAADDRALDWMRSRYGQDCVTVPRDDLRLVAADAAAAGLRFAPGAERVGNEDHKLPSWGGSTAYRDREF